MPECRQLLVGDGEGQIGIQGLRLDLALKKVFPEISRSRVQQLIDEGYILVNGRKAKASYQVRIGDEVSVTIPDPQPLEVVAEEIPLNIIYEDKDLAVINKPAGMTVHPAPGHSRGTLVNALLARCHDLSGIGGYLRPGIVHRLDKDTSGLMLVAKNDLAHLRLAKAIKQRKVKRIYMGLVHGVPSPRQGCIDAPIGRHPVRRKEMTVTPINSRPAITNYKVIEEFSSYSLIEARLETGRTHQIRVHMAYIGHPIVGDPVYGRRKGNLGLRTQALHAARLVFSHPTTGEIMDFQAPLPTAFKEALDRLRRGLDLRKGG
ncbi:MAG: RluA family pseudouridine synthase [Clostridia bacterium]|nr:RluA family pseudouridine synthase [Clostridia bacterium]